MTQAFSFTRSAGWLAAAVGALALTGCVVAPVDDGYYSDAPYYSTGNSSSGYYNGTYYPAIPYEVVPVAPYSGAIWVNGYWDNNQGHRYWRPGRYERPGWRPDNHRHDPHNWDRPHNNRPGWDRPNHSRPDWNNGNRPDRPDRPNRPDRPSHSRPPAHQFNPPGQSGGNPGNGSMLRPNPSNPGARPPAAITRPSQGVRPSVPSSRQSPRERFYTDPSRGGA